MTPPVSPEFSDRLDAPYELAKARVAIVEDNEIQAAQVDEIVREGGYLASVFDTATAFKRSLRRETYDFLLTDWFLPDQSGIELVRWMRDTRGDTIPIIMITVRTEPADVVEALRAGADDYVSKPVNGQILLARMDAIRRRIYRHEALKRHWVVGSYTFDNILEVVTYQGNPIELTPKEFQLAALLFENVERPLSRSFLLDIVWGHGSHLLTRTLDVHISRIRSKLHLAPGQEFSLIPVHNYGYRLVREKEPESG